MSGLLVVRYKRRPIILLYKLRSIVVLTSSLYPNRCFHMFADSKPNLFIRFLAYLLWKIKITSSDYLICKPKKKLSSPTSSRIHMLYESQIHQFCFGGWAENNVININLLNQKIFVRILNKWYFVNSPSRVALIS